MTENTTPEIAQVFAAPDGTTFSTKAEALNYLRKPKISAAMLVVTGADQQDLCDWLVENQDTVMSAFDTGTIRRISKSEMKKIGKAFDRITELFEAGDKALEILSVKRNELAIKYKPQPRMKDEEKALAAMNTLKAAETGPTAFGHFFF